MPSMPFWSPMRDRRATAERDALAKDEWQLTQVVTDPPVELAKGNSD